MSDAPLFMFRAEFDQPALMRFAHYSGLNLRIADGGYVFHAALRALFGDAAPRPFVVCDGRARRLTLFGYTSSSHRELDDHARALADPLAIAAIDLESICSKVMPNAWSSGAFYRFETRVCPVVRISGRSTGEKPREVDAFIHRCLRVGPDTLVDRHAVYREWLARELARDGAARLGQTRLVRFARERLARRDRSGAESRLRSCERPDVTLAGTLEVASPAAFAALLRRGVGRHRAFGFGMLLLRPAGDGHA
ncbi:MAG TPA: type I-E CRISPR-associated protein Cas6/Cse3/CasE [Candidatus Binataceae bacterium]|nr:type I-E CRISPR-associated protein Cas6/Cse3/CasE [Candidatus Binataceae bacterium]